MTYTELRDFLDGYTNAEGVIQGDPAIIAAEAVEKRLIESDDQYIVQFGELPREASSE